MAMVLVVDDKEMLRDSVGTTLTRAGMDVSTAADGPAALDMIAKQRPDCVVTDLKMPGMTGIELIEAIRKIDDELPVVLMTAFATIETAVKAIKVGAFDYVPKPFDGDQLLIAIKRAINHGQILRENAILKNTQRCDAPKAASGAALMGLHRLVGESAAMRRVKEQVMAVADSNGTVLICGESGTGKEVVARAVHELSTRDSQPFLGVNCAALSDTLLESELFGHEKGAFTGADKLRKGRFELADRGTLLLDEISEMPLRLQAKFLRVLQERVFERVGSSQSIGVDVRVIATSNRELPRSVAKGEFRQDLFFRLNVLPIHLPPLRDRLEDVPALITHFVQQISQRDGRPPVAFSDEAVEVMKTYTWPGNVRELQNICERAVVLSRGNAIAPELIRPWLGQGLVVLSGPATQLGRDGEPVDESTIPAPAPVVFNNNGFHASNGLSLPASYAEPKPAAITQSDAVAIHGRPLEDIEREAIVTTLKRYSGHRQKTAAALGIGVRTLGLKLKKWKSQNLVESSL